MNTLKLTFAVVLFAAVFSCNQPVEKATEETAPAVVEEVIEVEVEEEVIDADSIVTAIDEARAEIEANLGEPVAVATKEMKEKIKQKWEKIHFYLMDGQVIRVKTYPYENISARTEEFYLMNGELALAVIEDNGAGERGKTAEQIDKLYYFYNGEAVKEMGAENEKEYSVKDGDAEELMAELKEYLDIYAAQSAE